MDRPLRALQPAGPVERPLDLAPVRTSSARRKHIGVACNACRRRKSRCDGHRPICHLCKVKNTPCEYDAVRRKSVDYQVANEQLDKRLQETLWVFHYLQTCADSTAQELFLQIRTSAADGLKPSIFEVYQEIKPNAEDENSNNLDDNYSTLSADGYATSVDEGSSSLLPDGIGADGDMSEHHRLQMQMQYSTQGHMGNFSANVTNSTMPWLQNNSLMDGLPHIDGDMHYPMYSFGMPANSVPNPASRSNMLDGPPRHYKPQQEDDDMGQG